MLQLTLALKSFCNTAQSKVVNCLHQDMLLPRKKCWDLVTLVAVCYVLFLVGHKCFLPTASPSKSSSTAPSLPVSACPDSPPFPAYVPPQNGFDWRAVPVKYPVQEFAALPTGTSLTLPKIQHDFASNANTVSVSAQITRKQRQASVKAVFLRAWQSYKDRAWLADELAPISGGSKNPFGGWGATLVDNLDTLWLMDMKDDFEMAVAAATNISFNPESSSLESLNMFETTIRYLGGFLAAYDLTDCKDERLLAKAVEVGDMIYASFDTPNRMPCTRWNPRKTAEDQLPAEQGIIAEMASFSLEFTRLSQLTGDMRYYDAVARVTNILYEQQNRTQLPGMFPIGVDVRAQDLTFDTSFSFGAMADSAFEYFGKTYQLLGGQEPQYARLYEHAMDTAITHMLFRPQLPDQADILISGVAHAGAARENSGQHLSCFAGGMFLLGGRLFSNNTHIDVGTKLTNGCVWAYRHSPIGIMPERFSMNACPTLEPCDWDPHQQSAFTNIGDGKYALRPEAIESMLYLYRITGDTKLQDIAWEMFQSIDKYTRTDFANAAIKDTQMPYPEKEDSMESFWMAETLKYFYLIFSEPDLVSLDDYVFNTEAHPFRIPR
ncbi:mannosyl-oligosaccharide 1,2-alpha-mannosidase IC [Microthyrium microscopicum]|uniref:alpha-1,2-Mannosidase n=1 Tax=Microthyrium microscopicum TaxID=703497 RepID=A0A6A6U7P4_9PEZI|nr:mannosyl-oligosaccharide 1,2-alpha-mannosidase IC [Microthyrium microscopicum]